MNIEGLEVNSPEYWEIRHQRDDWPRWSKWAMSLVFESIPQGADVLEVGGGQGQAAIELRLRRPDLGRILSFDVSPTAIDKARKIAANARADVEFEVLDVFELDNHIKKNTFDYAFSLQNMEHWRPELHRASLVQTVLPVRPGGKIFITGVGKAWNLSQMNYSPMMYNGKEIQVPNDYHYNHWSEQEMYDMAVSLDNIESVRFFKRRGLERVITEISKRGHPVG